MEAKQNRKPPVGRSLGKLSPFVSDSQQTTYEYTLHNGRKVTFRKVTVPADQVETLTFAHSMNKRIAADLTRASLELLTSSISRQQYQPVIAQRINGKYASLDGTRRRQSAIYAHVGLDILYCDEELSPAEVKALSKELQTAKEHSIRDNGRAFAAILEDDSTKTQDDIAELEGFTQGYVSKALKAWSIPQDIVNLFEYPSDLTFSQFSEISKIVDIIIGKKTPMDEIILLTDVKPETSNDEVIDFLKEAAEIKKVVKVTDKPKKFLQLNAKKWANSKRVKEKTTITLNRATEEEYALIEAYIMKVMKGTKES
ncbi:MAG: ParB/RepB/Spo0J family partition protein [Cocleimonas sp.]